MNQQPTNNLPEGEVTELIMACVEQSLTEGVRPVEVATDAMARTFRNLKVASQVFFATYGLADKIQSEIANRRHGSPKVNGRIPNGLSRADIDAMHPLCHCGNPDHTRNFGDRLECVKSFVALTYNQGGELPAPKTWHPLLKKNDKAYRERAAAHNRRCEKAEDAEALRKAVQMLNSIPLDTDDGIKPLSRFSVADAQRYLEENRTVEASARKRVGWFSSALKAMANAQVNTIEKVKEEDLIRLATGAEAIWKKPGVVSRRRRISAA